MKQNKLKLIALFSGLILLVLLIAVLIKTNEKPVEKIKQRDYEAEKLLSIELLKNTEDALVKYEFDGISKQFSITLPKDSGRVGDGQVQDGSGQVQDFKIKLEEDKTLIKFDMKDYCTYETFSEGTYLYIKFKKVNKRTKKLIVLDAGHGGKDTGASYEGIYEKDLNLAIALRTKEELIKAGYSVIMTRESDSLPSVEARADFVNKLKPRYFISIHCNYSEEASASGTEVLYNVKDTSEYGSLWLSKRLASAVAKSMSIRNRGAKEGNSIHIVRSVQVPVALIETGFLSNRTDREALTSLNGQKDLAKSISDAIVVADERRGSKKETNKSAKK